MVRTWLRAAAAALRRMRYAHPIAARLSLHRRRGLVRSVRPLRRADPRGDDYAVSILIDAARQAVAEFGAPSSGDRPAAVLAVLRAALAPFDDYDEADDADRDSRYRFGCAECSVATDEHGVDRDGYEHATCLDCDEVGSGCTAGTLHAEHLAHQNLECFSDEAECEAPEAELAQVRR